MTRHSSEESETDYPAAWRHIPEERSCEPHLHANLKSRRSFVVLYASSVCYYGDQIKEPFIAHEEDEIHNEFWSGKAKGRKHLRPWAHIT